MMFSTIVRKHCTLDDFRRPSRRTARLETSENMAGRRQRTQSHVTAAGFLLVGEETCDTISKHLKEMCDEQLVFPRGGTESGRSDGNRMKLHFPTLLNFSFHRDKI